MASNQQRHSFSSVSSSSSIPSYYLPSIIDGNAGDLVIDIEYDDIEHGMPLDIPPASTTQPFPNQSYGTSALQRTSSTVSSNSQYPDNSISPASASSNGIPTSSTLIPPPKAPTEYSPYTSPTFPPLSPSVMPMLDTVNDSITSTALKRMNRLSQDSVISISTTPPPLSSIATPTSVTNQVGNNNSVHAMSKDYSNNSLLPNSKDTISQNLVRPPSNSTWTPMHHSTQVNQLHHQPVSASSSINVSASSQPNDSHSHSNPTSPTRSSFVVPPPSVPPLSIQTSSPAINSAEYHSSSSQWRSTSTSSTSSLSSNSATMQSFVKQQSATSTKNPSPLPSSHPKTYQHHESRTIHSPSPSPASASGTGAGTPYHRLSTSRQNQRSSSVQASNSSHDTSSSNNPSQTHTPSANTLSPNQVSSSPTHSQSSSQQLQPPPTHSTPTASPQPAGSAFSGPYRDLLNSCLSRSSVIWRARQRIETDDGKNGDTAQSNKDISSSQDSATNAKKPKVPMGKKKLSRKYSQNYLALHTIRIVEVYSRCNPEFAYDRKSQNPRRVLTKPSKGTKNDGYDNDDNDYILYVNDILGNEESGRKYMIIDVLGQGTFGQVVKCQNLKTKEIVAVKVVKNKPAYFNQSMMEVTILEMLNEKYDKHDRHHIIRMLDTFIFRKHLCLVFELLSINLYELIKQNQFRGLSTNLVRVFTNQILNAMIVLNEAKIIHCDLKPENILLKDLQDTTIKVIDFGSACHEQQTVYTYIQSRFYRSPEVLLGLPYSSSIDMWSLGCIVAELFLGLPLFPGTSEYNQLSRIVECVGLPPTYMLEVGKTAHEFFEKTTDENGKSKFRLKSMEQYSKERNVNEQPSKKYFSATKLHEIIMQYPVMPKRLGKAEQEKEMQNRRALADFLQGLLKLNPIERLSPHQAKLHPFITQQPWTGPFVPSMEYRNRNSTSHVPASSSTTHLHVPSSSRHRLTTGSAGLKSLNASHSTGELFTQTTPQSDLGPKTSAGTGKVIMNVATAAVERGPRPRANTISAPSLKNVPPQLQRLAAVTRDSAVRKDGSKSKEKGKEKPHDIKGGKNIVTASVGDVGVELGIEAAASHLSDLSIASSPTHLQLPNPSLPSSSPLPTTQNAASSNLKKQSLNRSANSSASSVFFNAKESFDADHSTGSMVSETHSSSAHLPSSSSTSNPNLGLKSILSTPSRSRQGSLSASYGTALPNADPPFINLPSSHANPISMSRENSFTKRDSQEMLATLGRRGSGNGNNALASKRERKLSVSVDASGNVSMYERIGGGVQNEYIGSPLSPNRSGPFNPNSNAAPRVNRIAIEQAMNMGAGTEGPSLLDTPLDIASSPLSYATIPNSSFPNPTSSFNPPSAAAQSSQMPHQQQPLPLDFASSSHHPQHHHQQQLHMDPTLHPQFAPIRKSRSQSISIPGPHSAGLYHSSHLPSLYSHAGMIDHTYLYSNLEDGLGVNAGPNVGSGYAEGGFESSESERESYHRGIGHGLPTWNPALRELPSSFPYPSNVNYDWDSANELELNNAVLHGEGLEYPSEIEQRQPLMDGQQCYGNSDGDADGELTSGASGTEDEGDEVFREAEEGLGPHHHSQYSSRSSSIHLNEQQTGRRPAIDSFTTSPSPHDSALPPSKLGPSVEISSTSEDDQSNQSAPPPHLQQSSRLVPSTSASSTASSSTSTPKRRKNAAPPNIDKSQYSPRINTYGIGVSDATQETLSPSYGNAVPIYQDNYMGFSMSPLKEVVDKTDLNIDAVPYGANTNQTNLNTIKGSKRQYGRRASAPMIPVASASGKAATGAPKPSLSVSTSFHQREDSSSSPLPYKEQFPGNSPKHQSFAQHQAPPMSPMSPIHGQFQNSGYSQSMTNLPLSSSWNGGSAHGSRLGHAQGQGRYIPSYLSPYRASQNQGSMQELEMYGNNRSYGNPYVSSHENIRERQAEPPYGSTSSNSSQSPSPLHSESNPNANQRPRTRTISSSNSVITDSESSYANIPIGYTNSTMGLSNSFGSSSVYQSLPNLSSSFQSITNTGSGPTSQRHRRHSGSSGDNLGNAHDNTKGHTYASESRHPPLSHMSHNQYYHQNHSVPNFNPDSLPYSYVPQDWNYRNLGNSSAFGSSADVYSGNGSRSRTGSRNANVGSGVGLGMKKERSMEELPGGFARSRSFSRSRHGSSEGDGFGKNV